MEQWKNGMMGKWGEVMETNLISFFFGPIIPIFHHSNIP
jgi:hypothetical protein